MPTPARWDTAAIGADGSSTNTSRAAARIAPSLRAACARRPLSGTSGVEGTVIGQDYRGTKRSALLSLNGTLRSVRASDDTPPEQQAEEGRTPVSVTNPTTSASTPNDPTAGQPAGNPTGAAPTS